MDKKVETDAVLSFSEGEQRWCRCDIDAGRSMCVPSTVRLLDVLSCPHPCVCGLRRRTDWRAGDSFSSYCRWTEHNPVSLLAVAVVRNPL